MTQQNLDKLKIKLPKDGSKLIHKKTGFSISYINMVLAGTKFSQYIIDTAIEVAVDHQDELKKKTELINSL